MNTTTKILLGLALVGIFAKLMLGGKADKGVDIPSLLKNGTLLIDARTSGEFSQGHIEGAINIPHHMIAEKMRKQSPDKSKPIILYCHSGARSSMAKKTLLHAGYTHVINAGSLHHLQKLLDS